MKHTGNPINTTPRQCLYSPFGWLTKMIVVALFCAVSAVPQSNEKAFQTISIESGLSQSSVFSILQDSRGFLWLGTNDGLNRYDGYNFVVYKPDSERPFSISGNRVFVIFEDSKGVLWVGTDEGLNRYDRVMDRFIAYTHKEADKNSLINNQVHSICEDAAGQLWIGTREGISIFNKERNAFNNLKKQENNPASLSNNFVWQIKRDRNNTIWVGTDRGLNRYDAGKKNFQRYMLSSDTTNRLFRNTVFSICEDHSGNLWIGTRGGLFRKNPGEETFTMFKNDPQNPQSLSYDNVYTIFEDSRKNLWIGTLGGGLNLLQHPAGESKQNESPGFIHYKKRMDKSGSLSNNYIWSLFEDFSGILWIGTDVGLNKYDPFSKNFKVLAVEPASSNSLIDNDVLSILLDSDGLIWIGTRNGLSCYDRSTNHYENFTSGKKPDIGLRNNEIKSLYEDKEKNIWIGTNGGGLVRYNKRNRSYAIFTANREKKGSISDNKIISICEDDQGNLWLGTLGGLSRLNKSTGVFTSYKNNPADVKSLSNDYIFKIFQDSEHIIWIGTNDGLNRFNPADNSFIRYRSKPGDSSSLGNNLILSIIEGSDGALWIGTNGGLHRFDKKKGTFTRFNEKNVLVNNVIYGMQQDTEGNLWLATNKGLTKFNPKTLAIRNYCMSDGIPSDQFNTGASWKAKDGTMYFGGINGVTYYTPSEIKNNPVRPRVVLTGFQIFNKPVRIGENSALKQSITESREIELEYSDNVFSFEFAALHFSTPEDNKYAYMMKGFDKEWQHAGTRHFVTYTNLDPGRYTFYVQASNNDGIWSSPEVAINLVINPPFWKTWWFLAISIALTLGIIYLIFYLRMRQLLAIEHIRFNIAADLHDDIGTKLTEISMLSDMIYHFQGSAEQKGYDNVRKIGQIARSMIDNLSDIIWLIKPERDSLKELLLKLLDSFDEMLSYSNIILHLEDLATLDAIKLNMEQRKTLLMILKEALHNCVKHSKCSEIWLLAKQHNKQLSITIKDNGVGFDEKQITYGNGLHNMQKRMELIKGTLIIQAQPDKGTIITLMMKVGK